VCSSDLLVSNAVKFTDDGVVQVRCHVCDGHPKPAAWNSDGGTQAQARQTRQVRIEVQDNGPGIPNDKKELVFQSFSQADASTTRRFGGTGLGLAICRQLAELMGGGISLQSELGSGSTFTVQVPFCPGNQTAAEAQQVLQQEGPCRKLRILVVEDNPANAMVCRKFLERLGHAPLHVSSGPEALELLEKDPVDLALMDVEMPDMNGMEVTRRIRTREDLNGRPRLTIVGLTAHATQHFKQACEEAGMDEFLTKPVDFYDLATVLQRYGGDVSALEQQEDLCDGEFPASPPLQAREHELPVLDRKAALRRFGGDEELLAQYLPMFMNEAAERLQTLRQALQEQNQERLVIESHALKGLAGTAGAERCRQAAARFEDAARDRRVDLLHDRLQALEADFEELAHEV